MTARLLALAALAAGALAAAAAYGATIVLGAAPAWAPWAVAFAGPTMLCAAGLLGIARRGRPVGASGLVLGAMLALCLAAFGAALALPASADAALLGALPRRAAILLYGIGVLPMVVLPLAYAMTFARTALRDEDLAAVRAAAARRAAPPA